MKQYIELCKKVLNEGIFKENRTNTKTISIYGYQTRYNLNYGFPLLTTKKIHIKSIIYELLWFISGNTNIKYLNSNGVSIWNEWADINGDLGPIYGKQWRKWEGKNKKIVDQLKNLENNLKKDPYSRRHILCAWKVDELDEMSLPPCHVLVQFYVDNKKRLSCQLYQRSADIFLGVPFNIASYSLLTCMFAQVCNLGLGEFIHTIGDAHIYVNHLEQVKTQINRKPYSLPYLLLNRNIKKIEDFKYEDIYLKNYICHSSLYGKVSV